MQYLRVAIVGTNDMIVSVTRTPLRDVTDCWSTPLRVASSVTLKSAERQFRVEGFEVWGSRPQGGK